MPAFSFPVRVSALPAPAVLHRAAGHGVAGGTRDPGGGSLCHPCRRTATLRTESPDTAMMPVFSAGRTAGIGASRARRRRLTKRKGWSGFLQLSGLPPLKARRVPWPPGRERGTRGRARRASARPGP